jgi:hypothetical protein
MRKTKRRSEIEKHSRNPNNRLARRRPLPQLVEAREDRLAVERQVVGWLGDGLFEPALV